MKGACDKMRVFRVFLNLTFAYLSWKSLDVADWFLGVHTNTLETVKGSLSWVITVMTLYTVVAISSAIKEKGYFRLAIISLWIFTFSFVLYGAFDRNFWNWLW
jgi:hypothetical protein